MSPGFRREQLRPRYDVAAIREDDWHAYSGDRTFSLVAEQVAHFRHSSRWLLNAGSGVYEFHPGEWREVLLDLFQRPILNRRYPVCASVEQLPFDQAVFGGIVCVGEVLAYCDPARSLAEFARVIAPSGILVFDFGSSRGIRYWLRSPYGRAAEIVTDQYNGVPERTWVYDPNYVRSLLASNGFSITASWGTHTWSALARRLGAPDALALSLQRAFHWLQLPPSWADVTTIAAVRP